MTMRGMTQPVEAGPPEPRPENVAGSGARTAQHLMDELEAPSMVRYELDVVWSFRYCLTPRVEAMIMAQNTGDLVRRPVARIEGRYPGSDPGILEVLGVDPVSGATWTHLAPLMAWCQRWGVRFG